MLFAIAELTELEERELLDNTAIEDDERTEDTTDDELEDGAVEEGAEEDEGIEDTIEEELERLLLDKATCELLPPTIPQGAGCEAQVEREIQLLLFSYPQPLWVFTHKG